MNLEKGWKMNPKIIFDLFEKNGKEIFLVGGAVRDFVFLKISLEDSGDLDFATNAKPNEIKRILLNAGLEIFDIGEKFGTIGTGNVQITTYRTEKYNDETRFPETTFVNSLTEDLLRRDFSINSMVLTKDGKLLDPYGGERDWKNNRLRTTSCAEKIFNDDPLRMLRAARFYSVFGLVPDKEIFNTIFRNFDLLKKISHERWLMEMDRLLVGKYIIKSLKFMSITGILYVIAPELLKLQQVQQSFPHTKNVWEHTLSVVEKIKPEPDLRWAALFHDIGKPDTAGTDETGTVHFLEHEHIGRKIWDCVADRFKMSNDRREKIGSLIENHMRLNSYNSKWSNGAVRRLKYEIREIKNDLFSLCESDITSMNFIKVIVGLYGLNELKERMTFAPDFSTKKTVLPSGIGNEIMKIFGLEPGKEVGRLKNILEQAVIDGETEFDSPNLMSFLIDKEHEQKIA